MSQAERYVALQQLTKREHNKLDSSYHAAFYLLSGDACISEAAKDFISVDGIDFEGLTRKSKCLDLDESQHKLLDTAHNLFSWTSESEVTPFDISRMGYPYMELVCNAIYIASGGYEVRIRMNGKNQPTLALDTSRHEHAKRIHAGFESMMHSHKNRDDTR